VNIHKALIDFWEDQDPLITEIHFSPKGVEEASADEVKSFNRLLEHLKGVGFDSKVGANGVLRVWWPHPANPRPNAGTGTIFQGTPDARQAATSPAPDAGPFRRRYRPLNDAEVNFHDRLKDKATELWALYDELLSENGLADGAARDIALAKTHLEDSVMRAVRALTA